MTRTFIIGGNWKLNGSKVLVQTLVDALNQGAWSEAVEVVIAPPAPYLDMVRSTVSKKVGVAAQNCHTEASGAYTGEISYTMLKDLNIDWVILGHSERRTLFKESDEFIAQKTVKAVQNGTKVMFCIGETLQEREAGETTNVCFRQLEALRAVLKESEWSQVVVAYEPVWAIGTGKVATPEQAQEVHAAIRGWLKEKVSPAVSEATRIMYGGSVNAKNCGELQSKPDVDGFLVGGASLKGPDFLTICQCTA